MSNEYQKKSTKIGKKIKKDDIWLWSFDDELFLGAFRCLI